MQHFYVLPFLMSWIKKTQTFEDKGPMSLEYCLHISLNLLESTYRFLLLPLYSENICPLETAMKMARMQMSFPETPVAAALRGNDAGCGGPGLLWLHMVCFCEASWMYWQILWNTFGGSTLPQNFRDLWHWCCVIKLHFLQWHLIVASLWHTCTIIILSNQYPDMPHLWGEWTDFNKPVNKFKSKKCTETTF